MCGDRSMGLGLKILDMDTGEVLLHLPNCASPSSGLVCLRNQFIAASQINRHGSAGGGAIGIWPLNKVTFFSGNSYSMEFFLFKFDFAY